MSLDHLKKKKFRLKKKRIRWKFNGVFGLEKMALDKGCFFSESADLQILKKIPQKTILSLKFKFQAQDSFLEHFF